MKLKGKAHKFGNDINTDEVIPAKFLNTSDEKELGLHCMEGITPGFIKKVKKGDIIVGGKNFGCGSSREHAPVSIKAAGIACVIAQSFARIFYRNAINIGLPILECEQAKAVSENSLLQIDLNQGIICDLTKKKTYQAQSFPKFMQELIRSGGLMRWVQKSHIK